MEIGKIVVEQRGKQNLSQRALAQKAGIRQATLSSIESGGEVKLTTAMNVLRALGMDIEVVPLRGEKKREKQEPASARQREIARMQAHVGKRRGELQALLAGLSARQISHVRQINQTTNTGYLAELWDEFLHLDRPSMQQALAEDRFKGMAWQSLLQANPFIVAGVGSWA